MSEPSLWVRLGWNHCGYRANRRGAQLSLAVILLPFLVCDLYHAFKVNPEAAYVDYGIFLRAARAFDAEPAGPIYDTHPNYLYPPFFLTLCRPLVYCSANVGFMFYQLAKWVALYATLRLAWRLSAADGEDVPPIVALGSLLLVARYYTNEMLNGNINMFVVAGVLAAAYFALRGHFLTAGFLAALLACVKVSPMLLLVYFIWKGWWNTIIGAVIGLLVGLLLWPALFIGWAANMRMLTDWYHHLLEGFIRNGAVYSVGTNQGLTAMLNRLLGSSIAFEPDIHIAFVQLAPATLGALRIVLTGAVLGMVFWTCVPERSRRPTALASAVEIALVQVAMLLLSGYTWKAHYVAMILPYTVLLACWVDVRFREGIRRAVVRLLGLSALLKMLTSDIFGPRFADYALAYGAVFLSALVAGAGLVCVRRELRGIRSGDERERHVGPSELVQTL